MANDLHQEKARLKRCFELAQGLPQNLANYDEVMAHWSRYLCVQTHGFVENVLKLILVQYIRERSAKSVAAFAESHVSRVTNLNYERFAAILGSFDQDWRKRLEEKTTDAQKAALDSVAANRNQIAHGKSIGLSFAAISKYYKEIESLVDLVVRDCVR